MEYHAMATKLKTALKELYPKSTLRLKWCKFSESTFLFVCLGLENGNEDDGWNFVLDIDDRQILMRDWVQCGNDYNTSVRKGYGKSRVVNFHLSHFKKAVKADAKKMAERAARKKHQDKNKCDRQRAWEAKHAKHAAKYN